MRRACLYWRIQNIGDRCNARDGFLGEYAELKRKGACKFAVQINGTAAHAGYDTSVLDLGAFQLNEDDGLFGAQEIGHDTEDFEVEFFNLVTGKNGVRVALHAGMNLREGKYLG